MDGVYKLKDIDTNTIIVGDCGNTANIMQDITKSNGHEAIWIILLDYKCLGKYNDTDKLNLNSCDTDNLDQHWMW